MTKGLTKFFVVLQFCILLNVIQACDPPCLFFSAGKKGIKSIELSSGQTTVNITVPYARAGRALAVALDVEDKLLYWSDHNSRTIKRIDLQSGKIKNVTSEVGSCEGVAIEWVKKYIYWTDNENNRIEMARVDGSERKLLFDSDVQDPRGITVDSVHGYLFWTDYGDNPKIERATLAGQERTTIIAKSFLMHPNDIIVDYTDSKIYWVDAGLDVVGKADLDGYNIQRSQVITNSDLFAIALYNDMLYVTDWKTKWIRRLDKESLKYLGKLDLATPVNDIFGITLLHGSTQPPVNSSCSQGNGGCSHLCFIVPDGYRCGCPNGTALREDGYSCQEANFTNCRNQPCQNGGTCYFNFAKFSDDCSCSKYYVEKDCGLYLGRGAVRITLEMKVEEWKGETFKQAVKQGLRDYCMGDTCSVRNKTNFAEQFCRSFLNNSAFNVTQVSIIGQPTESSPNHTEVDFAVILRPESPGKPMVVVNTTLEYIVLEIANYISERFGGYNTAYVNLRPPSDVRCNVTDEDKGENGVTKRKTKDNSYAILAGATSGVIVLVVLVVIAVWYRRNQRIADNEERNYEEVDCALAQNLARERRDSQWSTERDIVANQQIDNNEGDHVFAPDVVREQRDSQQSAEVNEAMTVPESPHSTIFDKKHFNNRLGLSMRRESYDSRRENRDIVDNQQRGNCQGYENPSFRKVDSQQSVRDYEDMSSSQALPIPQETSDGAMAALPLSATPYNVDQRDASSDLDETGRQPVENDENDANLATYVRPVQCTDNEGKKLN